MLPSGSHHPSALPKHLVGPGHGLEYSVQKSSLACRIPLCRHQLSDVLCRWYRKGPNTSQADFESWDLGDTSGWGTMLMVSPAPPSSLLSSVAGCYSSATKQLITRLEPLLHRSRWRARKIRFMPLSIPFFSHQHRFIFQFPELETKRELTQPTAA